MRTSGLIVEYNPFHNGHDYHFKAAKIKTNADLTVAVMSGNFLQRGEPAIIDKFSRTKAALQNGVDLVIELPFVFACQYADLFARGAIASLSAIGVNNVCFGSETGEMEPFLKAYEKWTTNRDYFEKKLKEALVRGLSFPQASREAYHELNLTSEAFDLSQPNNILGFSYVKAINELNVPMTAETIARTKSQYHDETIEHSIASATSIRKEILQKEDFTDQAIQALPEATIEQLSNYRQTNGAWHEWETYFPYLQYIVKVTPLEKLKKIHGMIEGLEYRLKQTASSADDFAEWMDALKTKRYTYTRLQRVFVHLLTQLQKNEMDKAKNITHAPYVRILGMNEQGRKYVRQQKKQMEVPLIANLQEYDHPFLDLEERAAEAYYTPLHPEVARRLKKQEVTGPIIL